MKNPSQVTFCGDDTLGYRRSLTPFEKGKGLQLDASYRLAHLPLVNPHHPDVIASVEGKPYNMGLHHRIHSLVLPVPPEALEASAQYQAMQEALRDGPFASKLAWDILGPRRNKLHATLCGSLGIGETPPVLDPALRDALKKIGPISVELRGFFSGNINTGRFYLKAYPEQKVGQNAFHQVQRAMGRNESDLYLVGLHNLTDHLSPAETEWLAGFIAAWWAKPILRFSATELWLLSSLDDLVLNARIEEHFDLGS